MFVADEFRWLVEELNAHLCGRGMSTREGRIIDATQGVARHLGVKRTGEAIAISTKDWSIFYRGAIDDQLVEGAQKPQPTERYLETALNEFLDGKPVALWACFDKTEAAQEFFCKFSESQEEGGMGGFMSR